MRNIKLKSSLLLGAMVFSLSALANTSGAWWNDIKNDRASFVKQAIEKGQDLNALNQGGQPPIIQAIRDDSMGVFDVLARAPNINLNIENINRETPLMYLAIIGDVRRAEGLIFRGAEVNRLGWAPLHYAASMGHVDMIRMLLANGAFPNAPAAEGSSPIYMAVTSKNPEAVRVLMAAGADPKAVNQLGKSAIDLARELNLPGLVEIMLR
ncbi:MAG: ankyrin repeat domain-containing protein [Advenella sp.]|nr:ankyrin repeat domain-containing protein [Advenella sp.]